MRSPIALRSFVSAVLGGLLVAVAVWVFGLGRSTTQTIVVTAPPRQPAVRAVALGPAPSLLPRFDPARIYAERSAGVVTVYAFFGGDGTGAARTAQGSGFVVSGSGVILTSAHVITTAGETAPGGPVRSARDVYVEFSDDDRLPARIVGWDVFDDVGVIRVAPAGHRLVPVPLGDSSTLVVGEPVAAIGTPLGNEDSLAVGVVSAVGRSIASLTSRYQLVDAIQTDAPITHGSSGGPLLDARGRVIGINAQIRSSAGSSGNAGVGFAVPIDSARRSLAELLARGRVSYAYVGVTTEDLTPALARRLALPVRHGALVDEVTAGSPAAAGLRGGSRPLTVDGSSVVAGGDVIVAIDTSPIESADELVRVVAERLRPHELATFAVLRGSKRMTVRIRLGARVAAPEELTREG